MPAAQKNVVIEGGANWRLALQWPLGAPYDLSAGWAGLVQLRHALDDVLPAYDFSTYVVCSAGSLTLPNIVLDVPPAATLLIADGVYEWAFAVHQTADPPFVKYLLAGQATKVTRAAR